MNIDKRKIEQILRDFGLPVLMVISGLILLLNPDGATVLVTKLVGWVLVIWGASKLVIPTIKKQPLLPGDWIVGGILIIVGVVLLAKPLILANLIGQLFGMAIALWGVEQLRSGKYTVGTLFYILCGIVLFVLPRTLTNVLLAIIGVVLILIGGINILGKLNENRRLEEAKDPNIIDADM